MTLYTVPTTRARAESRARSVPEEENNDQCRHDVCIETAKKEFKTLEREISRLSRSTTRPDGTPIDPEKAAEEEPFDLRDYLSTTNDENAKAGIQHKHVGVTWEGLEVSGMGGANDKIYIRTFADAIIEFILLPWTILMQLYIFVHPKKGGQSRVILQDSHGVLKPGEMCLVLGRPGSGCTTFLKAIANQRGDYAGVTGDVLYAGIDADEMAKRYKGEVVYNQEDDVHIPTLTVAQTLHFALSTKTPGKRIPGVTRKQFNHSLLNTLLRMLNISHTHQTLVGNEFIRGVSGGERKRVSIAEMMATRAHVSCWDGSTRGLDSSTALDFVKSLRVTTDLLGQTTFVSLYQAGESIYELFDKVMVIDQGRQVYFGPASEARAHFVSLGFEDLPRQTTADYLTGCTDPNERRFAEGKSSETVPSTPLALQDAFRATPLWEQMKADLKAYKALMETEKHDQEAFRQAVLDDKKRGVSKKSPYTISFWSQVKVLTNRQFRLQLQDSFTFFTSFALSTIMAIVIGVTFYDLPQTSAGGFTRGSVIFLAILVNCLDAFGEMPTMMLGRGVLYKQTGYSFFTPSAIAIANALADLPFSATRLFIFDVIVYFMANLTRNGGAFWTFHLFTYVAFLTLQGFFRTFGILCPNFDSAFRIATFFIPNMITYCGYIIPVFDMQRWLFWIYYLNPLNYGFAGVMENEFGRVDLTCDGSSIVPRNFPGSTTYPEGLGPNQVCTFFGAETGQTLVKGSSYIKQAFDFDTNEVWKLNFVVLVAFYIFFILAQVVALEYVKHPLAGATATIFAKENADTKERNQELKDKKASGKREHAVSDRIASDKPFTWENVNYHVPVPGGGQRQLLNDVFGYVKPGTLTALMGASGAGKTTCLDVLAQRKNIGIITGDILVAGRPLGPDFARGTAYAEQLDVHEGSTTVREALRFSAYLRQPYEVSQESKDAYVEEIIELLELQDLADAMVLSLGVEARKRLTIGVELSSKPELLLVCDEPTSGLDGQSAWNLVRFLRKLADAGQAILCTIHQPSALLFESFDRLLLLQKGGETVYFGDIGRDSEVIRAYFARYGAVCPPTSNMAEYMLDAIGAGLTPRVGPKDWGQIWLESPEFVAVKEEIKALKAEALAKPEVSKTYTSAYATPFWYQVKIVTNRSLTALWRSPDYVFTRLFVHVWIAFFVSMSLLQLGHTIRDLQYRVFGIFWVTVLPAIVMAQIEPLFIINRMTFIREASSGIYSPYVFAIGQLISEMPYSLLCAVLFWVLLIWPMGFGQGSVGSAGGGYHFLMIVFLEFFGVSLGQAIAAISPSIKIASLFNPFLALVLSTYAGVTIPYPVLPRGLRWLYQLSPYTRVVAGMLVTELKGLQIVCRPDEFAVFEPPSGQTCATWAGEFVSAFGGYLQDPNATSNCQYCQYKVGDEYFTGLGLSFSNRWRDIFILFSFFIANVIITIVASRFLRFAKR